MMTYKDENGRTVITMSDPPVVKGGKATQEIISTHNIEEVLKRRREEEAEARAKAEAETEEELEADHAER